LLVQSLRAAMMDPFKAATVFESELRDAIGKSQSQRPGVAGLGWATAAAVGGKPSRAMGELERVGLRTYEQEYTRRLGGSTRALSTTAMTPPPPAAAAAAAATAPPAVASASIATTIRFVRKVVRSSPSAAAARVVVVLLVVVLVLVVFGAPAGWAGRRARGIGHVVGEEDEEGPLRAAEVELPQHFVLNGPERAR
jgi:hypothetical protein